MLKHRLNQFIVSEEDRLAEGGHAQNSPKQGSSCSIDHAQVGLQRGRIPKQTRLMRPLGPVQTGVA
jgi:hypothetical protein